MQRLTGPCADRGGIRRSLYGKQMSKKNPEGDSAEKGMPLIKSDGGSALWNIQAVSSFHAMLGLVKLRANVDAHSP